RRPRLPTRAVAAQDDLGPDREAESAGQVAIHDERATVAAGLVAADIAPLEEDPGPAAGGRIGADQEDLDRLVVGPGDGRAPQAYGYRLLHLGQDPEDGDGLGRVRDARAREGRHVRGHHAHVEA